MGASNVICVLANRKIERVCLLFVQFLPASRAFLAASDRDSDAVLAKNVTADS